MAFDISITFVCRYCCFITVKKLYPVGGVEYLNSCKIIRFGSFLFSNDVLMLHGLLKY